METGKSHHITNNNTSNLKKNNQKHRETCGQQEHTESGPKSSLATDLPYSAQVSQLKIIRRSMWARVNSVPTSAEPIPK